MQTIWKRVGQTPLQALEELREREGIVADVPMTYAGRLDPLAEGKLIILAGEECKQKEKYLGLDKEYEFEVLFGTSTDTGDVMGIINKLKLRGPTPQSPQELLSTWSTKSFVGKYSCEYPAFSSKTVRSEKTGEIKPLFLWALEGRLDEIELPKKEVEIYKLELLCTSTMTQKEVLKKTLAKIVSVPKVEEESKWLGADFRREQVIQSWHEWSRKLLDHSRERELTLAKFRCVCSSGTYVRTLARDIARELDMEGLAWSIKRTKIGKYKKLFNRLGVWLKRY